MANIAIFDSNQTPNPILSYLESVNTPDYSSRADVLVNPALSNVTGQPMRYWKHVAGAIELMTQGERDAVDAAIAAGIFSATHTGAKNIIDAIDALGLAFRALADTTRDEINILRTRDRDRSADVAASTSLADLKTRWAAESSLTDRTLAQLRTVFKNKMDGGTIDS